MKLDQFTKEELDTIHEIGFSDEDLKSMTRDDAIEDGGLVDELFDRSADFDENDMQTSESRIIEKAMDKILDMDS